MYFVVDFLREEEAATAVEYAVMLALVLMAIFSAVGSFGHGTGSMWNGINHNLESVGFFR